MMVHRDQAEQVVVRLGDRLRRPVLVHGADLELLQVASIGMGAARLACSLLDLDGMGLAHGCLEVSFGRCPAQTLDAHPRLSPCATPPAGARPARGEAGDGEPPCGRRAKLPPKKSLGSCPCATPATSSSPLRSTRPSRSARSPSSPPG